MRTKLLLCTSFAAMTLAGAMPAAAQTAPVAEEPAAAVPTDQDEAAAPAEAEAEQSRRPAPIRRSASGDPLVGRRPQVQVEERGDIVVTGSRFSKVLDQPQSKSLIDAEARNLSGIANTRQLIDVTPGFVFTETFGLNVRGIGRQTAQTLLGQENTVIQYVDGFINLVPSNIAESTLFGGNVQFLRGPGGTQYGRNSLAGSINLISRAPTKEFVGQFQAGYGTGGSYNVGFNVSGPVTDNFGVRVGAQRIETPSISKNLGPDKDAGFATANIYAEFQAEWRIGGFHIRNRLTHFTYDNQPGYATLLRYNTGPVFNALEPNPQYRYTAAPPDEPREFDVNFTGYERLRDNLQNITNADLDLGFATLFYVGGYQQYRSTGSTDRDLTSRTEIPVLPGEPFVPGSVIPTDYRTNYDNNNHFWSQEVRLESQPGNRLNWVLGGYYFNQSFDESYWENIANATPALSTPTPGAAGLPLPIPANPRNSTFEQRNIYDIRSTAVFGNATYELTDTVRIDGGLRYTWDEKRAITDFRYVYYYPPVYAEDSSPLVSGATTFRRDDDVSGRVAVAWRPSSGNQLYAMFARGYQASAFTLGEGLPPNNVAEPMNLNLYEVGGNVTSGRLRFDGSVFYQDLFDQQIPISSRNVVTTQAGTGFGPVFTRFENAARSRIYGTEAQLTWRPNDRSNIVASYTYLNSKFTSFCPERQGASCGVLDVTQPQFLNPPTNTVPNPLAPPTSPTAPSAATAFQDLTGNVIPRVPQHKASLYGYYGIDLGGSGTLYPGGSVSYQSSYYSNAFQREDNRVAGRTLVGLTLTYRTADERLDITGTVSNLFNQTFDDNRAIALIGGEPRVTLSYGAPRVWNIVARYRM